MLEKIFRYTLCRRFVLVVKPLNFKIGLKLLAKLPKRKMVSLPILLQDMAGF